MRTSAQSAERLRTARAPARAPDDGDHGGPVMGRIPVLDPAPLVDGGRCPPKAVVGETFEVSRHRLPRGPRRGRRQRGAARPGRPRRPVDADARAGPGHRPLGRPRSPRRPKGRGPSPSRRWSDPVATWRHNARIKIPAGIDIALVLAEGAAAARARRRRRARRRDGRAVVLAAARRAARRRRARRPPGSRRRWTPEVAAVLDRLPAARAGRPPPGRSPLLVERGGRCTAPGTSSSPARRARVVEPGARTGVRARCAPRPSGCRRSPRWASTWSTCRRSTRSARPFRKGPNNTLTAGPDDVGSPWAIGSPEGGHDAIHPDLGTLDDFDRFVARAARAAAGGRARLRPAVLARPPLGDRSTPSGSRHRADGTIAYAENPPKKYQDIYPIDFDDGPATGWSRRRCGSCGTGWSTACGSSGSTTRTPSRWSSGSG